ncbi:MAG: DUF4304 domain-containing protein [Ruminiclostridium sp.]|nr:DUF4304 domain-containing protein [Ruminiclostridium sp.]
MTRIEEITVQLAPLLKEKGYKKNRLNWYKQSDGFTTVFTIQRSQFGSDLWYYCFGIGLNDLETGNITTISKCCITEKIENTIKGKEVTADILQSAINRWEERFGDMNALRKAAVEGKLPKTATRKAYSYLTAIHF